MQFDYVIVGAGSAGCVLAARLSDNPANRVLLLEAGGTNQSLFIRMAGGFVKIMGKPDYFWSFPVRQQPGRRRERHSYGKGLGGSSAINGTWYMRGLPRDFDEWRDSGLPGWGWNEIERCYRTLENYRAAGADPSRGRDGGLQITPSNYQSDVFDAIATACTTQGVPWLDDINAPGKQGVGRTQYTVTRNGQRATSYEAFVAPIRNRQNLTVVTDCQVKSVVVEQGRATAVICEVEGQQRTYRCARDIIVSAGVYKSPQLLQLSGIGPGALLAEYGIPVVRDLPVGANLCDHQKLGISFDLHNHPGINREFISWRLYRNALRYLLTGGGPLARVGLPLTMMVGGKDQPADWPDFQLAAAPFAMRTVKEMVASPGSPISDRPGITFSGYHLRPRGRGTVAITSADFKENPLVDPAFWSDPYDQSKAIDLLKWLRALASAPALSAYVGKERAPGAEVQTEQQILDALREMVDPGFHGVGTCSMGTDTTRSVVDARCRVHGVGGLRVVDCSIMPNPLSGNTNGPAMAIGARAAELILEDARS